MAQRVVRRVHGQPGHRRRHRVRRRVGRQRLRPPPVGADRRPAAEHPPGRRQRRGRRVRRAAGLRRHLLRQGLEHPQAAQRHARRRGLLRRRRSTTSSGTASATRPCTTCSRAGSAPAPATCRRSPPTGCAPPARTGSRSTGPPAWSAVRRRRPPRRPHPHLPASRSRPTARGRTARSSLDAPETPFDVPAGAAGRARPLRGDLGPRAARRDHGPGARRPCCPRSRTRCCAPASGTTCAAASTTPPSTPPTSSTSPSPACRSRTPRTPDGARWPGCSPGCCRWHPPTALGRLHDAALAKLAASEPGSEQQLAAFRAAIRSATDLDPAPRLARPGPRPGSSLDLDLRWRVLVRLAALGATDRAELRAALAAEPTARSRVEHTRAVASLPDAEAKAWAWDRFTGEVDVPNYELEAAGHGLWRGGQEDVTAPYVERYFADLPATVDVRSGWVLADATEYFFPRDLAHARTRWRAPGRWPPTRTSTCRSGAGWSTRPTTWPASSRSRRPSRTHDVRPRPPPRTDGPDPGARADRGRRPAPRGPAGHRGAARDPAGLAGRRRAAGLGDDAHARPRLRAGRRLAGARGARRGAVGRRRSRLLHRRRPDAGAGVQRRHGDPRPAAAPRPGPPARRPLGRVVGVRGLRQGLGRRRAGPARGDPLDRRAPLPRRRPRAARPAASTPAGLRPHRRRARRRSGHRRRRAARRPRGRRAAQRRRQGHRRPGARRARRPPRRAWWSAAGPASSWCRRRSPPASGRWSPSARRPASPRAWPRAVGPGALRLHPADRCVRYT